MTNNHIISIHTIRMRVYTIHAIIVRVCRQKVYEIFLFFFYVSRNQTNKNIGTIISYYYIIFSGGVMEL